MASWYPDRYRTLREALREARLAAGLTQAEVAAKLNVPQQHVSRVELGERRIDPVELQELATLYGREAADFLK